GGEVDNGRGAGRDGDRIGGRDRRRVLNGDRHRGRGAAAMSVADRVLEGVDAREPAGRCVGDGAVVVVYDGAAGAVGNTGEGESVGVRVGVVAEYGDPGGCIRLG